MSRWQRFKGIVVWSVISAAFIGPGTVTTAVSAGSLYGLDLLWAVVLATASCIVLQEVSARICIASGLTLGKALEVRFGQTAGRGWQYLIGISVILGCAAYEAGNILGAVSGLSLLTGWDSRWLTVGITAAALIILLSGRKRTIGWLMSALVAVMGAAFMVLAFLQEVSPAEVLVSAVSPSLPPGSELLALGLVGTTIVPYNIFIGAAVSYGQQISHMRLGLTVSVLVGGAITAAIVVAGTGVNQFDSFEVLSGEFQNQIGKAGALALALGLFAAGFSSAVTSPYASGIIGESVFGMRKAGAVRAVWMLVLATGFLFGISGIRPIPVILVVQALNGLILPVIAYFLLLIVNDSKVMPPKHRPGVAYNLILLLVFGSVLLISLNNVDKSVSAAFGVPSHLLAVTLISAGVVGATAWSIFRSEAVS
jgi:Mn2+/Fe2+ NRAMP family transporter